MNKLDYTLTLVRWRDSKQPTIGWVFSDEIPTPSIIHAETVGFIVKETDDILVLAQSAANVDMVDAQVNGCMQIPKCCITDRFELAYHRQVAVSSSSSSTTRENPPR